jgi:hypothetical protein
MERSNPTVCITCVWAGVDNVWEQRKLEATRTRNARLRSVPHAKRPTRPLRALLANLPANQNFCFGKLRWHSWSYFSIKTTS